MAEIRGLCVTLTIRGMESTHPRIGGVPASSRQHTVKGHGHDWVEAMGEIRLRAKVLPGQTWASNHPDDQEGVRPACRAAYKLSLCSRQREAVWLG